MQFIPLLDISICNQITDAIQPNIKRNSRLYTPARIRYNDYTYKIINTDNATDYVLESKPILHKLTNSNRVDILFFNVLYNIVDKVLNDKEYVMLTFDELCNQYFKYITCKLYDLTDDIALDIFNDREDLELYIIYNLMIFNESVAIYRENDKADIVNPIKYELHSANIKYLSLKESSPYFLTDSLHLSRISDTEIAISRLSKLGNKRRIWSDNVTNKTYMIAKRFELK